MQLYHQCHKIAYKALQGLFLRLFPLNRPRYQTDTSSYNTTCATLERLPAPGRPPPIPDTTATPGRCTGQHRPSIIIRYIRGCSGAPLSWIHARRCSISQTMPAAAGSRCFPRPAACNLAPGQRSGAAVQSSSRSGRAAEPLAATAASLFGLSPDS